MPDSGTKHACTGGSISIKLRLPQAWHHSRHSRTRLTPWTISKAAKHYVYQNYQSCLCQLSQRWSSSYCLSWRAQHCAVLHGQVDLMTPQRASAGWLLPCMQSRGHEVRPQHQVGLQSRARLRTHSTAHHGGLKANLAEAAQPGQQHAGKHAGEGWQAERCSNLRLPAKVFVSEVLLMVRASQGGARDRTGAC